MVRVKNSPEAPRVSEAVLFPFDSSSFPFTAGLRLQLVSGRAAARKNPIVLDRGEPGEPDDAVVRYPGTVIQVGEELRMWYLAYGSLDAPRGSTSPTPESNQSVHARPPALMRLCYAVSRDGLSWQKPSLGLVEYNGSRDNNIIDLLGGRCELTIAPIIYDPDDPDPARRFKMNFESTKYKARFAVAYSPDGLRWTESPRNPVGPWMEQAGLIRFNGCYYVNGQGGSHYGALRTMVNFASYDFEHWTQSSCMGFRRDNIPPRPMAAYWNIDEEVHQGAGLWDRGNVIIGIYGMWHGHPTSDRSRVAMDLGLVVSNDALTYREPVPDYRFIPSYEESDVRAGEDPALVQGQGMCNVGEQTLFWYGPWRGEGVRLATWPRDRLGYFEAFSASQLDWARHLGQWTIDVVDEVEPHCITCPIQVEGDRARVYLNIDGIGEHSSVTVELLDRELRPITGYSGDHCIPLTRPGLREPVVWKQKEDLGGTNGEVRLRLGFGGVRPEDARLHAIYVTDEG